MITCWKDIGFVKFPYNDLKKKTKSKLQQNPLPACNGEYGGALNAE